MNQRYTSGTFKWRNIPNEASKYGIELIPAPGFFWCSTTDQYSVIGSEGTLQLRITDAYHHRDAAAPELPRLHLLHPLRDAI